MWVRIVSSYLLFDVDNVHAYNTVVERLTQWLVWSKIARIWAAARDAFYAAPPCRRVLDSLMKLAYSLIVI
jgi:hypothetical protein